MTIAVISNGDSITGILDNGIFDENYTYWQIQSDFDWNAVVFNKTINLKYDYQVLYEAIIIANNDLPYNNEIYPDDLKTYFYFVNDLGVPIFRIKFGYTIIVQWNFGSGIFNESATLTPTGLWKAESHMGIGEDLSPYGLNSTTFLPYQNRNININFNPATHRISVSWNVDGQTIQFIAPYTEVNNYNLKNGNEYSYLYPWNNGSYVTSIVLIETGFVELFWTDFINTYETTIV